jgi:hypothetical protein
MNAASTRTNGGHIMSQGVVTTPPVRVRRRTTVIAIGLFALLAIGVAALVVSVASGESEPSVPRATAAPEPVPASLRICGNDATNLLAAIRTMPPTVQAQVVASLSHPLSDGLGTLASNIDPSALPPAPDATTLGAIMTRLELDDRAVVEAALPDEQRHAVLVAEQSAEAALYLTAVAPACS